MHVRTAGTSGTLHTQTDRQTDRQTGRQKHSHSPRVDRKLLNISASSNSVISSSIPTSDMFEEEMDLERLSGELASLK